ncbi:MAG TPA: NTP transferase domain-containing protein [Candidatus Limnocylindrales bacterium]|nr:NTP transferase domain-containing protein [Candidatus Limnocylindrales bacterium]
MTVAAVILSASPEGAIADADGLPSVRRIADAAWSGGAVPIVVVSFDPSGAVAQGLTGAPVTLAEPAPVDDGPKGQMVRGLDVARAEVQEVTGALIWPARMVWVGPETITSLIEAHGVNPDAVLRPSYADEVGWPALVPASAFEALAAVAADRMPPVVIDDLVAAGVPERHLELGDPGVTHDRETARADLPPYVGPTDPPAGHVHEWGAQVADQADDAPLEGPALAPYAPAASGEAEGV